VGPALPTNLQNSLLVAALQAICELDLARNAIRDALPCAGAATLGVR